jgi:transmembrane sensor
VSEMRHANAPGSAAAIKARAADWLMERSLSEDWSSADQARLDEWLSRSPAHEVAFARMEATWQRTERLTALETNAPRTHASAKSAPLLFVKLAAAFLLIAIAGGASAWFALQPRERSFATPVGGHETVNFADGSSIELNTNTVIRTRMTTEERVVWLDRGEAFFRVKHDPLHPFIVVAGSHRVTDLGTQFVVRHDVRHVQVMVVQGRVWLEGSEKQKSDRATLLTSGDIATASGKDVTIAKTSAQTLASSLGWRHGVLVFKHTTLAEAAAQFNRYNRKQIFIADSDAGSRTIGGTFPTGDVDDFTHLAEAVLRLHVTEHGDTIVISR